MFQDRLGQLYKQRTLEDSWKLFLDILSTYGIDRAIYAYTNMATAHDVGSTLDALVLSNLPQRYLDFYLQGTTYQSSPMTIWAENSEGACSWSRLPQIVAEQGHNPETLKIIEANARFGITTGYTVAFPQIGERSKGAGALIPMTGMTQEELDNIWEQHGKDIELLFQSLHHMVLILPHSMGRSNPMSPRQLEILELKADGKTTQDISNLLNISTRGIEKHLSAAREALGAETTAHAVRLLADRNLFFQIGDGPSWE